MFISSVPRDRETKQTPAAVKPETALLMPGICFTLQKRGRKAGEKAAAAAAASRPRFATERGTGRQLRRGGDPDGARHRQAQARGRGSAAHLSCPCRCAGAVLPAGGRLPRAEAQRLSPCPLKAGRFDDRKKAESPLSGANPKGQFREAPFIRRT